MVDGKLIHKELPKAYERTRKAKIPSYLMELINKSVSNNEYLVDLTGRVIYKNFITILKNNNLPHMTFHDLRHVNASVMSFLNIPEKYAMERGGWKTNNVMKNVYQHTYDSYKSSFDNVINNYFDDLIQHELQHDD